MGLKFTQALTTAYLSPTSQYAPSAPALLGIRMLSIFLMRHIFFQLFKSLTQLLKNVISHL